MWLSVEGWQRTTQSRDDRSVQEKTTMSHRLLNVAVTGLVCIGLAAQATATDWVAIGDPGNAADTVSTGTFGSVGYAYAIGKTEVTQGEYVEFLNAVAADDPNGLYNYRQGEFHGAGVVQSGSPGSYTYSLLDPVAGRGPGGSAYTFANKPINFVTFFDGLRYANWLHNGKPVGPQGPGTTEGGAYTIINGVLQPGDSAIPGAPFRNADAKYWLPSEDEWYKAAYYDPTLNSGAGGYYDYPTAVNTPNTPDNNLPSADTGNSANYTPSSLPAGTGATGDPEYPLLDAGAYTESASPYGTLDQGGSLYEFLETPWNSSSTTMRGGSWWNSAGNLQSFSRLRAGTRDGTIGFRVAGDLSVIPEPTTLALLGVLASILLLASPRRRSRH